MNFTKIISCLFPLLFSINLFTQIDWNHPNIEITTNDGLPSTYIKDFAEDEYGFIWILTYSGLCRFDGSHLEVFQNSEIPNEGYLGLEYDAHRKMLWITHVNSLYAYDLQKNKFRRFPQSHKSGNNPIFSLAIDSTHQVWVGMRNFFGKVSEEQDTILAAPIQFGAQKKVDPAFNRIYQILTDPIEKDKIWIATEGGLVTFSPSKNTFQKADEFIGNKPFTPITHLFGNSKNGRIYFGKKKQSQNREYLIFDAKNQQKLTPISFQKAIEPHRISIFQDSLLLFNNSEALQFFNEKEGKITRQFFNTPQNPNLYSVDFIDSKGNIWTGSHEGVKMYQTASPQATSYFYHTDFPNWFHIPADLDYDKKSNSLFMPVAGGEGLYQFDLDTRSWQLFPMLDKNGDTQKTLFSGIGKLQNGRILAIANKGFYQIGEKGTMIKSEKSFAKSSFGKTFIDSKNVLWGVNNRQIVKLDLNTQIEEVITEKIHFCTDYLGELFVFEDSQSNIWIAGLCGGFDYFNRKENTFQSIDFQGNIKGTSITGIDEFDGKIWAKTDNAELLILDVNAPEKGIIETILLKEKVANNELKLVNLTELNDTYFASGVFDKAGKFWFFSHNNLYSFHPPKNRLESFDESVGIVLNDPDMNVFVANHLRRLPDGNIAYSVRKGICIFNPLTLTNEKDLPQPYIHAIDVNNELISADSSAIFKQNYYFQPRENFIGFDFSALDFSNPNNVEYRYKLEGVDETWKSPGKRKYISYTDLKGGDYIFQLKASNEEGIWSEKSANINFTIEDFWYNTLWAKVLFVIVLIATIFAIYMSRLKRAIEKEQLKIKYERELAEIKMQALTAQMNPHFIFNSLNSIDYYIIKNDTKKASRYLNRFSRLMRLILKNSQSNYITLKDDLDALKLYLEIEALRFNHQFDFEIKVADNVDTDFLKIPPMLIQPYVENSIWHGLLHKKDDGKITIHFEFDESKESLKCSVIDNGIGRKKSMELKAQNTTQRERKSFGMNITKDKIEALKFLHGIDAKVEIFDLYDIDNQSTGTKVELIIPV